MCASTLHSPQWLGRVAKSKNASPQSSQGPGKIPGQVLRRLARLGSVPAAQRKFFFESICQIVQTACELDGLVKQGLANERGKKLVRAILSFYDAVGNLNKRERAFIEDVLGGKAKFIFGKISDGGVAGLEETAYELALLFSLVTGKPPPRYPSQTPEPPQPGRRSGTVKDWIFRNFASQLYISTVTAGGSLSLEKNTPTGSLIDAIDALARCLPEGFVPRPLPGSTLQRIKDECTRAAKEADELGF
jgi:hypothetical protein